jgi:hypothetical protein
MGPLQSVVVENTDHQRAPKLKEGCNVTGSRRNNNSIIAEPYVEPMIVDYTSSWVACAEEWGRKKQKEAQNLYA